MESDEKEARKKFVFLCPLAGQVIATVLEGIKKKKKKIPSPSYPFFLSRSSFLLRCPTTPASSSLPLPAGLRITAPFPSFSAVAESKLPAKREGKTGCGLYRSARERSHLVISLSVSLFLSPAHGERIDQHLHITEKETGVERPSELSKIVQRAPQRAGTRTQRSRGKGRAELNQGPALKFGDRGGSTNIQ